MDLQLESICLHDPLTVHLSTSELKMILLLFALNSVGDQGTDITRWILPEGRDSVGTQEARKILWKRRIRDSAEGRSQNKKTTSQNRLTLCDSVSDKHGSSFWQ